MTFLQWSSAGILAGRGKDDYELTDQEHREIVTGIKERDIRRAEEALLKHLIRGEVASIDLA